MDPSQIFELPVDRSLQPDGKTVDSRTLVSRNFIFIHRTGIHLDRNFGIGRQIQALFDFFHRAVNKLRIDHGGRSSAEIDGIESQVFEFFPAHFDFFVQARHICLGKIETVGKGSKIAIGAFVFAKRYMEINSRHLIRPPKYIFPTERNPLRPPRPRRAAVRLVGPNRRTQMQEQAFLLCLPPCGTE